MAANALAFDWETRDESELRHNAKTLVRFLKHCKKKNGLLYWGAGSCKKGYGRFQLRTRLAVNAHRVAYALLVDLVPKGMCVCHKNDEPSCVDPSMLFLGTNADNIADMVRKGRGADRRGERHSMAKLSKQEVLDIRRRYRRLDHPNLSDLAKEYGVSTAQIHYVISRKSWSHI